MNCELNIFINKKHFSVINAHLYSISRTFSGENDQSKEGTKVWVDGTVVLLTTEPILWVLRQGDASCFN
jgi:hypothetical protein